ncbi:MAG: DUF1820 family protein [Pseudomonadota bacterium]
MSERIYKISFFNQGKVYEVFARSVHQGELYGFVEIEDLLFGETASVVIDPSEERLKAEFEGVSKTLIPLHAVIRIDEVEKRGTSKIRDAEGGNVTAFPSPAFPPGSGGNKP